jgi:hypothetical protein
MLPETFIIAQGLIFQAVPAEFWNKMGEINSTV